MPYTSSTPHTLTQLGLMSSAESSLLLNFLFSNLVLNGLGSVAFHWTLTMFTGFLDVFPMGILVFVGMLLIYSEVGHRIVPKRCHAVMKKFEGMFAALLLIIYLNGQAMSISLPVATGADFGTMATALFAGFAAALFFICGALYCFKEKLWHRLVPGKVKRIGE